MSSMETDNLLKLIERIEPGLVLFDNAFNVKYINQSLLLIFPQISKEELFRSNLLQLHEEQPRKQIREVLRLMKDASRPVSFTIRHMGRDRRERFLFLKLMPLFDDSLQDALNGCLVYDITPFITTGQRALMKIPVSTANGINLIDPSDIIYVKAENIYSRIYTARGDFFCDLSLGVIEEGLSDQQFIRIHRSYIINIGKVDIIDRDAQTLAVIMRGDQARLPVSRSRAKKFLQQIGLR
jgi:DNA-binding LytR/AlgR family response regulator